MNRRTRNMLVVIASVLALIVIALAIVGAATLGSILSEPDARPGVHVPCLASLPHCDEPANGIWSTR